jgi:predicted DNA-binding transcriptional regulator AlpA
VTTRLALQRKEAAAALGVAVDTFDRHIRPDLRCVYVGGVRLWPVAEIERWLAARAIMPGTTRSGPGDAPTPRGPAQGEVTP